MSNKQLRRERMENALAGCEGDDATEFDVKDIQKDIAKVNTAWTRQAERDGLRPGLKMRRKDGKIDVI